MENISVRIIKDSLHPNGSRLTTAILRYPRFIHSELMTHRAASKNSASSRAIPLAKMLKMVREDSAHPEYWGTERRGMQSGAEATPGQKAAAFGIWRLARGLACLYAEKLGHIGIHKSIANRLLEPFCHMTVIFTAETAGLHHMFALRANPMAQPEFQVLTYRLLQAYLESAPRPLEIGQWHMPFDDGLEYNRYPGMSFGRALKICTGRIARVSYLTHEGVRDEEKDIELHDRLKEARPMHASPFEHCAQAIYLDYEGCRNFGPSWFQYRQLCADETSRPFTNQELQEILRARPEWIKLAA